MLLLPESPRLYSAVRLAVPLALLSLSQPHAGCVFITRDTRCFPSDVLTPTRTQRPGSCWGVSQLREPEDFPAPRPPPPAPQGSQPGLPGGAPSQAGGGKGGGQGAGPGSPPGLRLGAASARRRRSLGTIAPVPPWLQAQRGASKGLQTVFLPLRRVNFTASRWFLGEVILRKMLSPWKGHRSHCV